MVTLSLLQDELDNISDAILAADSAYGQREWAFATARQIIAVNGMLNAAAGSLPRPIRILTLARLCGYNPSVFRSSKSLSVTGASRLIRWGYGKENVQFDVDPLDELSRTTIQYTARISRDEVHKYKRAVKQQLLRQNPKPIDPVSGHPAWVLHEILDWPGPGDKEGRSYNKLSPAKKARWDEVAEVYFVDPLCILLDNDINVGRANSLKMSLLKLKMAHCGPECVVAALKDLASKLMAPEAWMPAMIEFNGQTYKVLEEKKDV